MGIKREITSNRKGRRLVIALLVLIFVLLVAGGVYAVYGKIVNHKQTDQVINNDSNGKDEGTHSADPDTGENGGIIEDAPDAVIGPGESATVRCGAGDNGKSTRFGTHEWNIGLGSSTVVPVEVFDSQYNSAGGMVIWSLFYRGTLEIKGCSATFIAPSSIGTASSASATIVTKIAAKASENKFSGTGTGEGGPIMAGSSSTTSITILSGTRPTCFDPAGVSISMNSANTTDNVQFQVDTPRFQDRIYNGRTAVVRDGPGSYHIEVIINGSFYKETYSQVSECQLPNVRF